jgi:hypothetical protein
MRRECGFEMGATPLRLARKLASLLGKSSESPPWRSRPRNMSAVTVGAQRFRRLARLRRSNQRFEYRLIGMKLASGSTEANGRVRPRADLAAMTRYTVLFAVIGPLGGSQARFDETKIAG